MPFGGPYLSNAELKTIIQWIKEGAKESVVSEVATSESAIKEIQLMQNFPNPFNPSTKIEYNLPKYSFVTIKIYDASGKEVHSLVGQNQNAGSYMIEWKPENLPSGVYYYRLIASDFTQTKKMAFLK